MTGLEDKSAPELLAWALETYGSRFAIVTSFQAEGMVQIDMASRIDPKVRAITLDTGRVPPETLEMLNAIRTRYGIEVEVVQPDSAEVAAMVSLHGPDLFLESPGFRQLCCEIRKVRPLQRKLTEVDAWSSGMRRQQSENRSHIPKAEQVDGRWKLSPLAEWTKTEVWDYIRQHDVPVHPLYARGYTSIGCAPCTRAVQPGEEERAGRWWWEQDQKKECGLHFAPDGRAVRELDVLLSEVIAHGAAAHEVTAD